MLSLSYIENIINDKILNIHTAFLGKVKTVDGSTAKIQPLQNYKMTAGTPTAAKIVTAHVPKDIKYRVEKIKYMTGATATTTVTESHSATTTIEPIFTESNVFIPEELSVDDLVICLVCERDISNAKKGLTEQPTNRHHDVNDSIIIRVL